MINNLSKQAHKFVKFGYFLTNRNQKTFNMIKPYACFVHYSSKVKLFGNVQCRDLLLSSAHVRIILLREKSTGKRAKVVSRKRDIKEDDDDDDEEEEEDEEDEYIEDGALVKTYNLTSLRIDLILKQVLKQKRKKIEEFFYNNKIRVNEKILFKKAGNAKVGDKIDLIKGISKNNSELIEVARIEILDIESDHDNLRFHLKIKCCKSLEINNYPEGDSWKEPEAEV